MTRCLVDVSVQQLNCSVLSEVIFFFLFFRNVHNNGVRIRTLDINRAEKNSSTSLVKVKRKQKEKVESMSLDETTAVLPLTNDTNRNSLSSNNSKSSESRDICRICHCERTDDEPLISPCFCLGTMKYLHQTCLQRWIKSSGIRSCELCKFEFIMHSEVKPFKQVKRTTSFVFSFVLSSCFTSIQWQKLNMNGLERRKIICSVAFNLIAVVCVLWSLYVLIEKTRDEVANGTLSELKINERMTIKTSSSFV